MKKVKLGVIGLGSRGYGLMRDNILHMTDKMTVTAVCDVYEDRCVAAADLSEKMQGSRPKMYENYHDLLADDEVTAVLIASSWEMHVPMAVDAMRAGKAVALEVGGAYDIRDCWELVDTYEATKTPFMFLENCCFGRRELMVLNMVRGGLFGHVAHCSGGYQHDLRDEISHGKERRHYRLRNYLQRNCENYPTHELGPIARVLNINHGNRMLSLVSVASASHGLHDYIAAHKSDDTALMQAHFAQADIVTTVIKCAGGETITLTLDTTLPRYYSRGFTVRGTKGMYEEATDSVFLDGADAEKDFTWLKTEVGNADRFVAEYEHDLWKPYINKTAPGGHGGMDWLEFEAFFDCLLQGKPMPIDVYDAASWMAISALSEQSVAAGGQPVAIPDFTRGRWTLPETENR